MDNNEQKIEVFDCQQRVGIFKKVPASELSLDDAFMKHQPKTEAERNFKYLVEIAIKNGLKDFYRPVCDPSFNDDGYIGYHLGKKPAVGKSYVWWEKVAKEFKPEQGSRLGTKTEYIAFLALLIKELYASGWSLEQAWNTVCNDSKELGHYGTSKDAKRDFEFTGSRDVCGWYDLANAYKIMADDKKAWAHCIASGNFCGFSFHTPLAYLSYASKRYMDYAGGCGWIVFDSCPEC